MSLDVYFKSDVRSTILSGLVLAIQTAHASGANVEYLRGILAGTQHTALSFGVNWSTLLIDTRLALGTDLDELLNVAKPVAVLLPVEEK